LPIMSSASHADNQINALNGSTNINTSLKHNLHIVASTQTMDAPPPRPAAIVDSPYLRSLLVRRASKKPTHS
jgi:hypothetical protein